MRGISSEITIDARPEKVWEILTDFARYHEWNPLIVRGAGEAVVGSRLELRFRMPEKGKEMVFKPTVLDSRPGELLRWRGRLLLPGIFDGTHRFELSAVDGGTRVVQGEHFSGVLVPFTGSLIAQTEQGFGALNAALKERVEAAAAAGA